MFRSRFALMEHNFKRCTNSLWISPDSDCSLQSCKYWRYFVKKGLVFTPQLDIAKKCDKILRRVLLLEVSRIGSVFRAYLLHSWGIGKRLWDRQAGLCLRLCITEKSITSVHSKDSYQNVRIFFFFTRNFYKLFDTRKPPGHAECLSTLPQPYRLLRRDFQAFI